MQTKSIADEEPSKILVNEIGNNSSIFPDFEPTPGSVTT